MSSRIPWARVLAEGVIIVTSILLAFGIEAWWDARSERADERAYLTALRSDFQATKSQFEIVIESYDYIAEHNKRFLRLLDQPVGSVPVDSLESLLRTAFTYNTFTPVLATYTDMVNSGALDVLRSDSLRATMARFEASLEWVRSTAAYADDHWTTEIGPFLTRHVDLTKAFGSEARADIGTTVLPPVDLGPQVARVESDAQALWSREFINLLAMKTSNQDDLVRWGRNSLAYVEETLRLVDRELER